MHRVRAKANTARPFHTSEIGINGDGVTAARVQEFHKHPAAPLRFGGTRSPPCSHVPGFFVFDWSLTWEITIALSTALHMS